jgi:hypothetical protein
MPQNLSAQLVFQAQKFGIPMKKGFSLWSVPKTQITFEVNSIKYSSLKAKGSCNYG